ncbi:MAG: hypothetical protein R3F59_25720 [Myxococcota bacterium]
MTPGAIVAALLACRHPAPTDDVTTPSETGGHTGSPDTAVGGDTSAPPDTGGDTGVPPVVPGVLALTGDIAPVHDPMIAASDTQYYAFSTGQGIEVRASPDLFDWTHVGSVFATVPGWITTTDPNDPNQLWAPHVASFGGSTTCTTPPRASAATRRASATRPPRRSTRPPGSTRAPP